MNQLGNVLESGWDPDAAPTADVVPHGSIPQITWLSMADALHVLLMWGGPPHIQWCGDWPEGAANKVAVTIRTPTWADRAILLLDVAGVGTLTVEDEAAYDFVWEVSTTIATQLTASVVLSGGTTYPDPLTGIANRPLRLTGGSAPYDTTIRLYKDSSAIKVHSTAIIFARSSDILT